MHIWFNCSLVTQSLNFRKRERESVCILEEITCAGPELPLLENLYFYVFCITSPIGWGPLWNYVFFLTHYQIMGVWSFLRPAYYQFSFGYQFPLSCMSICFEIPNLKVTGNWNWYIRDFWESLIWSSMYYFKDNFRNNYLIFKPNYFFLFFNFFWLLIFFITISHLS